MVHSTLAMEWEILKNFFKTMSAFLFLMNIRNTLSAQHKTLLAFKLSLAKRNYY